MVPVIPQNSQAGQNASSVLRLLYPYHPMLVFLRKAMMYADADKFFLHAWKQKWREMNKSTRKLLEAKYGAEKIQGLLDLHEINPKPDKKNG